MVDVDILIDQAVLSGLLSRSQIREARAEAEDGTVEALTRTLLRKGWITSWHRDKLLKGDSRGFFYGPYKVLFHIAEGTFARVYRGERTDSGDAIAIKVLRRRFTTDTDAVNRFAQEAEAGMELVHPNIVRIYEYGESDGNHFMAMEYVEGSNLRDFLKLRHRLDHREAMPILLGLAHGMAYSHENGVTHRDIKGTNILISTRREAKLVDFGLADVASDKFAEVAHTRTVDYSALERACGSHKGDWRSDIYFLGCVYYQMLTGVLPLPEVETDDMLAKMLKRSFGAIKPISELRYAPPPELCRIIEKMMRVELIRRYQMFPEVVADLEAFASSQSSEGIEAAAVAEVAHQAREKTIDDFSEEELLKSLFDKPEEPAPPRPKPAPTATAASTPAPAPAAPAPPPEPVAAAPAPAPVAANGSSGASPGGDREILCVEAQDDIRGVFEKTFKKLGYRVRPAREAGPAVEAYRESPTDLIVYDADGQGPDPLDPFLQMHEAAGQQGREMRALVILGPRQVDLSLMLPDDDHIAVLAKPIRMKDVQNALQQVAPNGR